MSRTAGIGPRGGLAGPRPGLWPSAAALLAAALLAAACAAERTVSTAVPDHKAAPALAAPRPAPPSAATAPASAEKDAPAVAEKTATRARPRPNPAGLLGMAPKAVRGWIGSPTLRRRDPPAEIWQYAEPSCVLFLFLYRERDGANQVWHYEMRPRRAADRAKFGDPAARDCFDRLIERRSRSLGES